MNGRPDAGINLVCVGNRNVHVAGILNVITHIFGGRADIWQREARDGRVAA